jgi:hypothetical protein
MALTLYKRKPKESVLGARRMSKELKQLDIEELYQLSARIDEDPVKIAGLLFPDRPAERVNLTEKIGQWAINQTIVLESHDNNKPDVAFLFNKVGYRIWQQLPEYAQSIRINIE